jgi:DNA-binding CsgD family transcriptional regulator
MTFACTERDRRVVRSYREGATLREIAVREKLSHEGVRQILLRYSVQLRCRGSRSR